jgi:hypothetical protein
MLDLLFIFVDPCAERRFLVCSRRGVPTAWRYREFEFGFISYFL